MVGRQVIIVNREFTPDDLHDFMKEHRDVNEGGKEKYTNV